MEFKFEDFRLGADIVKRDFQTSLHTGNPLEILEISFTTRTKFNKPEFLNSDDKKWKITSSSSSYIQGSSDTTYNWTIEEVEKLKIEKLLIADLEVEPYLYSESIETQSGNALSIDAVAEISKETWQNIKEMDSGEYFSVIREGISPEEKEMRFGQILWSENDGNIKCRFVLVEKIFDDFNHFGGFLEPEISNIKNKLFITSLILDNLLNLLSDKDILTKEEIESIKTVNDDQIDLLIFNQVKDLDLFLESSGKLKNFEKVE